MRPTEAQLLVLRSIRDTGTAPADVRAPTLRALAKHGWIATTAFHPELTAAGDAVCEANPTDDERLQRCLDWVDGASTEFPTFLAAGLSKDVEDCMSDVLVALQTAEVVLREAQQARAKPATTKEDDRG